MWNRYVAAKQAATHLAQMGSEFLLTSCIVWLKRDQNLSPLLERMGGGGAETSCFGQTRSPFHRLDISGLTDP